MAHDIITPYFWVSDMATSLAFYRDGVGLAVVNQMAHDGEQTPFWAFLRSGNVSVMLSLYAGQVLEPAGEHGHDHGPGGRPDGYPAAHEDPSGHRHLSPVHWIYVSDLDASHARLVEHGFRPEGPPEMRPYGIRDFTCFDPDGYPLVFGPA